MIGFEVEYLCMLDNGCRDTDLRHHSIRCQRVNEERREALFAREAERRQEEIRALGLEP